jgi:hypothetical protein
VANKLNVLTNMAAFNPKGAEPLGAKNRDEGYLYWAGWLGHNGDSVFSAGDGNGFYRRIYFTIGCDQLLNFVSQQNLPQSIVELVTGFTTPVRDTVCPPSN